MTNRQVCWTAVLEFVERRGINPANVLAAGTPQWCQLDDHHPDKLAAVLAAGVHHALRVDLAQEAAADASKTIGAAGLLTAAAGSGPAASEPVLRQSENWSAVARQIRAGRGPAYVPRHKETTA
ncbi:DUF2742 domain-containing protein [Mycolicibacter virginiensis]|uniref:DUF2742 domain-containing protein n=1 Tax=Mycolicibacter virginiensis TaxID=1795032 RepID=A0A9X7IMM3_9MYCO|nr:DUF2742 domain-containing protein [Mycolicibacter virginiensis]PQM52032.1 hypothetical protein C5U48_11755 [Mycolicibacter virginiensis]ULP47339.1 DUF2742 domain-containing protein [Mycolicibacter virginiensis]